jgi:hypothetical protein
MAQPKEISPQALQEMEERLDRYFADVARPGRIEEIKNKLAKGQSLTQTDGVFALWWFQKSLDAEFLRQTMHPEVKLIAKQWKCNGVDEMVEQFVQWYKPSPPADKFQPPPREFVKVVIPKFVDGGVSAPALTELGYRMNEHGAHGFTSVSVKPLDPNDPDSPARIAGIFFSHYSDHFSGDIAFGDENCIPSKKLLYKATGFRLQMTLTEPNKVLLTLSTRTQSFEVMLSRQIKHILDTNPIERLQRWLKAIDTGVDRCTLNVQQRCTVYLHAIAMKRGLVKLLIHSARKNELFDLSAVMLKDDLIRQFEEALDSLPADNS